MRAWPAVAAPGRYARLSPAAARVALAALPAMAAAGLFLPRGAEETGTAAEIAAAVRAGASFYQAAGDAARAAGPEGLSFWSVPLPLVPLAVAALPGWLVGALLWLLAGGAFLAVHARAAPMFPGRGGRALAGASIAAGLAPLLAGGAAGRPEAWAGLLVALSTGLGEARKAEAAATGLAAACVSPVALPFLVAALLAGSRRDAGRWAGALALALAVLAAHRVAVARFVPLLSDGHPAPADGAWGAFVLFPGWAAGLTLTALWAWTARTEPLARVAAVTAAACLLAAWAVPLPFGTVLAVVPLGLALLPSALAGAWGAATRRTRRFTVRRVTP